MDEKTPLLTSQEKSCDGNGKTYSGEQSAPLQSSSENSDDKVKLKRTISLGTAVIFIMVNCTGTGIYVVPSGIMRNVGSIGTSLIIWASCAFYNLVLALCYAELGTTFPMAGGDYTYVQKTLGPLPGFMCLFTYVLLAPVATAVMARTVGEYLMPLAGLECNYYITVMLAIFLNFFSAALNTTTVKWTGRTLNVLMVVKLLSFCVIIVIGLVELGKGNTQNFSDMFAGSSTSPSAIITAIIPAYTSFAGWDLICSLAEELKNPKRDIPLSLMIAVFLTTCIYLLINVAFFTVLTPEEVSSTNAVGGAFAAKVMVGYEWLIPAMVAFSALGTLVGVYLGLPRYVYAGAKDGQLPEILSHLSIHYFTPLPSIMLQCTLSIFFCSATFFDVQALFLLLGVNLLLKMALALVSLIYIKWKLSHLPRTVRVPLPIVVICLLILLCITVMSVIQDPFINGFGLLLFSMGFPFYLFGHLVRKSQAASQALDKMTYNLQCLLMVVPAEDDKTD